MRVVGCVATRQAALLATRALEPGVVVVASAGVPPALPELLDVVRTERLQSRVLVVGAAPSEAEVLDALAAGARGHVVASAVRAELAKAVRVVASGQVWCSRALVPHILRRLLTVAPRICPSVHYPFVQ